MNSKIGSNRVRGDARTWPANIPASQLRAVRPGDVAIFRSANHVAYIETAEFSASGLVIRVSEMNWGRGWVDQTCSVTSNFGLLTERTIAVNSGIEFMRPGGYAPARQTSVKPSNGAAPNATPKVRSAVARGGIRGRWREANGTSWEFLSDGSVITSSEFSGGGRWAALDDGRYTITMNVMLAGNVIMIGRVEGDSLILELRGRRTVLSRSNR